MKTIESSHSKEIIPTDEKEGDYRVYKVRGYGEILVKHWRDKKGIPTFYAKEREYDLWSFNSHGHLGTDNKIYTNGNCISHFHFEYAMVLDAWIWLDDDTIDLCL